MLGNGSKGQLGILIFKMARCNFYKFKERIIGRIYSLSNSAVLIGLVIAMSVRKRSSFG